MCFLQCISHFIKTIEQISLFLDWTIKLMFLFCSWVNESTWIFYFSLLYLSFVKKSIMLLFHISHLRLARVLVLGQIDPRDGAERPEKLLQICLPGVLGKVGHTDCSIIISCGENTNTLPLIFSTESISVGDLHVKHAPLRLGCMDSPLRVPPSRKLGGTYFPVLLWTGWAGSGSRYQNKISFIKNKMTQSTSKICLTWHEVVIPAAFSFSPVDRPNCSASSFCIGPSVSLYGQRVVQWSPLQIRQDTIFCPFSLFIGSSSWSWAFKSCKTVGRITSSWHRYNREVKRVKVRTDLQNTCVLRNNSFLIWISSSPSYLFTGDEGHEDVITHCSGGNIRTRLIKFRVAKFLPVLLGNDNQSLKKKHV